ncbi:hypothetical protein GOP47_0029828 [Adiantum capillus-veneris]|nr:hypothetical protein GOP47_0029828 [Adiantum capillus-veneris]
MRVIPKIKAMDFISVSWFVSHIALKVLLSIISLGGAYHRQATLHHPILFLNAKLLESLTFSNSSNYTTEEHIKIFDVMDFGAKADGIEDDTPAFNATWAAACASNVSHAILLHIPEGKRFLLFPHSFKGPCQSPITFKVEGHIIAPRNLEAWTSKQQYWLEFKSMYNFTISGNGTFNGHGKTWWSCVENRRKGLASADLKCQLPPNLLRIVGSTNVVVENLKFINAQRTHIDIYSCHGVQVRGLTLKSPSSSPNTDGIHIQGSTYVDIQNCSMQTGDDCISIGRSSFNVTVKNINCGPGHGISVGSLGKHHSHDEVSNISVSEALIASTRYGVRIKTWQGGLGFVQSISFQNITMYQVRKPILIDQFYCTKEDEPCLNMTTTIKVRDVLFRNITGTSSTKDTISFLCDKNSACQNITLDNVNITSASRIQGKAICINANGLGLNLINPPGCFQ